MINGWKSVKIEYRKNNDNKLNQLKQEINLMVYGMYKYVGSTTHDIIILSKGMVSDLADGYLNRSD